MISNEHHVTEEEAQLYDRQIRLWGMEAQMRLKQAKVLVIGISSVSGEIIKNLVLSGINKITLCDTGVVTDEDQRNNFMIDSNSIGKNRAKCCINRTSDLNSRVTVEAVDYLPKELYESENETYSIDDYHIVILASSTIRHAEWQVVNSICRDHNKQFFAIDTFGWHGITFIDLGNHEYVKEEQKPISSEKDTPSETTYISASKKFVSLHEVLKMNWQDQKQKIKRTPILQFLLIAVQSFVCKTKRYLQQEDEQQFMNHWTEYAKSVGVPADLISTINFEECLSAGCVPVNAVLGGLVTQEIIKAISKKNDPFGNFLFFDGLTCAGSSTFLGA